MKNRMINARQDYEKHAWNSLDAAFFASDIKEVIDNSSDIIDAIYTALLAGFMIGYRKAQRDARKN